MAGFAEQSPSPSNAPKGRRYEQNHAFDLYFEEPFYNPDRDKDAVVMYIGGQALEFKRVGENIEQIGSVPNVAPQLIAEAKNRAIAFFENLRRDSLT